MKNGIAPYLPKDTLDEALAAQKGIHALRDQSILMLSHYMGLRAMELAALTVGGIYDFRTQEIKEIIQLFVTKGDKFREVPFVNERARATLREYLKQRNARYPDAPLFLSQRGGYFSGNTMQRLMAICYRKGDIAASSHSGRRSFATNLIEAGADVYTVQTLMGHSSILTTQKYFTKSPMRMKKFVGLLI